MSALPLRPVVSFHPGLPRWPGLVALSATFLGMLGGTTGSVDAAVRRSAAVAPPPRFSFILAVPGRRECRAHATSEWPRIAARTLGHRPGLRTPAWLGTPATRRAPGAPPRPQRRLLSGAPAPAAPRRAPPARGMTIDFPYEDEALLLPGQQAGGRVWIPRQALAAGGRYPLLVLLHGVSSSPSSRPHRLLRGAQDLSRVARRLMDAGTAEPVLIAAPSQTAEVASSGSLWRAEHLDLAELIHAVEQALPPALGVRLRRDRVSVLGHSGAGCVLTVGQRNGLLHVAEQARLLAERGVHLEVLGLMDTCFYGATGAQFLRRHLEGTGTRILGMWVEPEDWDGQNRRGLEAFARALGLDAEVPCDPERYERCQGDAAGSLLLKARETALLAGLHDGRPEPEQLAPHSGVPIFLMEELLRRHYPAVAPARRVDDPG